MYGPDSGVERFERYEHVHDVLVTGDAQSWGDTTDSSVRKPVRKPSHGVHLWNLVDPHV